MLKRVENVQRFRQGSKRKGTRGCANRPTEFYVGTVNDVPYLAIPETSSENRVYIPMAFLNPTDLSSNAIRMLPNATLCHFGILTSSMHMAWTRCVCGRLKSDYRYSAKIVYNNFPWPEASDGQRERVESLAQAVLDVRAKYPDATLADLYDPKAMPPDLVKAHRKLDRAVERLYRSAPFKSDSDRVALLFQRYKVPVEKLEEKLG